MISLLFVFKYLYFGKNSQSKSHEKLVIAVKKVKVVKPKYCSDAVAGVYKKQQPSTRVT